MLLYFFFFYPSLKFRRSFFFIENITYIKDLTLIGVFFFFPSNRPVFWSIGNSACKEKHFSKSIIKNYLPNLWRKLLYYRRHSMWKGKWSSKQIWFQKRRIDFDKSHYIWAITKILVLRTCRYIFLRFLIFSR